MRHISFTFFLSLIGTHSFGQNDFDLNIIKFKGLGLTTTKKEVITKLGPGKRIETNYDCGFFSSDQSKAPYYQLGYPDFRFIGSDKDNFYLQSVDFDLKGKI